jgi:hypothetical protein
VNNYRRSQTVPDQRSKDTGFEGEAEGRRTRKRKSPGRKLQAALLEFSRHSTNQWSRTDWPTEGLLPG